jgi:hypothetical protein
MSFNFAKDWMVLVVMAVFIFFVVYVIIASRREDKDKQK